MSPSLKTPLIKLNRLIGHSSAKNHATKLRMGDTDALDDEKQRELLEKTYRSRIKEEERERGKVELKAKRQEEEERGWASEPPEIRRRYGLIRGDENLEDLPPQFYLDELADADGRDDGDTAGRKVSLTARIHHIRPMSTRLAFILLRQQVDTIQAVLEYSEGAISERFIRWAEHLKAEGQVLVEGTLRAAVEPVTACTIHHLELVVQSMHLLVPVDEPLSVNVYNMDRMWGNADANPTRVSEANRIAFLRTPTMQSVFRLQSRAGSIFRSRLEELGFIEIHTPKLQPAATESGAEVFQVRYFNRKAFLAQSPQLAKQMAISADLRRVYEVGPVFRAENSNTHRHLTEYTGLDLEMAIDQNESYEKTVEIVDDVLKRIFAEIYSNHRKELDQIQAHYPLEDLVWLDKTPHLTFSEGIKLLNESGWVGDDCNLASELEDLSTRAEIRLGQLVKEKFGTDFYILDKFPAAARPFYTCPDPDDDQLTNSFDMFVRGQEIATGGQRIHDADMLRSRMSAAGIDSEGAMAEYLEAFVSGAPPHAGCGLGLERLLFLMLGLGDIRNASLFPRDPKSLQDERRHGQDDESAHLPHPEADTIRYAMLRAKWEEDGGAVTASSAPPELPRVEDLIANYGDATNTSWLDARYRVWRDEATGAAVGYAEENGYAMVMGDPLCDRRQLPVVIKAFLTYLRTVRGTGTFKDHHLRPIWLLTSAEVANLLSDRLDWRALTCVAEERVDPRGGGSGGGQERGGDETKDTADGRGDSSDAVAKKTRRAEKAGVKVRHLGGDECGGEGIPPDVRRRCDARVEEWKAERKNGGKVQVHMTEVEPWVDAVHRHYFWAEAPGPEDGASRGQSSGSSSSSSSDDNGNVSSGSSNDGTGSRVAALVVLHRLAPRHGWQVKYALDFPGAPAGSIEAVVSAALQWLARSGVTTATFGTGAAEELHIASDNLRGLRARVMAHTYRTVARQLRLAQKSGFRQKFGACGDPVYICYPWMGLGASGVRTLIRFFEDEV